MALIKCKECNHQISSKAKACPNCGYQIRSEAIESTKSALGGCLKFVIAVPVIFILIVLLVGLFNKKSEPLIPEEQVKNGNYLHEQLKKPVYKNAFNVLFSGETEINPWLKEYILSQSGVESPSKTIVISEKKYDMYDVCEPHNCPENVLYVLFNYDGSKAWGYYINTDGEGTARFFGIPNIEMQTILRCTSQNNCIDKQIKVKPASKNSVNVWVGVSKDMYLLESANTSKVFLAANKDVNTSKVMIGVINTNQELCKEDGSTSDLGSNRVYKINGRSIRIHTFCLHGNEVQLPNSYEEKDYLVSLANGGQRILVEMDNSTMLSFDSAEFASVRNNLEGH